ncbi:hypothetical protein [Sediminibacterium ginsengisoli]|uniref:N-terminal double-transmembrane domain-containing protein n=1 Tax=Sediminibacterium ginsengisoli TaxID=413434 RepID=A0A1T4RBW7_9BACT|nr:hypothetical protein [Sediminibacterium ginsengisoli]SKA13455.1 hypothetical protein SAMN04488132_111104 [Sediminibacterium ginsengisoli]
MMQYRDHIVIVLTVIFTVWLLYKEWHRIPGRYRAVRIASTLLAAAMLACIGLEPVYTVSETQAQSIILLSEDADPKTAEQFSRHMPVYPLEALQANVLPKADTIHLLGAGLTIDELKKLSPANIVFHPDTGSTGITTVHWNNRLNRGQQLLIEGICANHSGKAVTLQLYGYGKVLDTAVISPGRNHFRFHTIPLHRQKSLFRLLLLNGRDTLENNPVPVIVTDPEPFKVLLLAAAPDFEYRFLKEWLSQQRHSAAVRTMISKNKFSNDFINMKPIATGSVTPRLLDEFDLLIADAAMLDALKPEELAAIYRQVTEKGMGLLTRADTSGVPGRFYTAPFRLTASAAKTQRLGLHITGSDSLLYALEQDPLFIQQTSVLRPLVTDTAGRYLAALAMAGKGHIALTSFHNASQWVLGGNGNAYNTYWTALIQAITSNTDHHTPVIETPMPRVNQPAMVRMQSTGGMPQVQMEGIQLSPAQDAYLSFNWTATWWPMQSGWVDSVYVYDQQDWPVVKKEVLKRQTVTYIRDITKSANREVIVNPVAKQVPRIWFVLLFLLAMTVLWWERKTARS